ncbi:MAG: ribosomal protein S18-alanine N-acetyltransferase [Rhodospirillaceae bacterium]|nr:ribosomal protein S18-alanine N-acetyltransferase [Rhodospirillaceae bacterium]
MNKTQPDPQLIAAAPAHALVLGELHARAFIEGGVNLDHENDKGITAQGNESWNAASIVATLSQPGVFGFIALDTALDTQQAPVGFVLARTAASESEILTLAVDPKAQRTGWGQRLMEACMAKARTSEAEKMFLEVAADNDCAIALYRHLGFQEVGVRKQYYRRQRTLMDALVMALDL